MPARSCSKTLACYAATATLAAAIGATIAADQSIAAVDESGLAAAPAQTATSVDSWGDNSGGELGNGAFEQSDVPVIAGGVSGVKAISAGNRFSLALLSGGGVLAWGENQFGQLGDGTATDRVAAVSVQGLSGVITVAAGGGHSLALLSSGKVMAWGYNAFGQLGNGTTTSSSAPVEVQGLSGVTAIAAGQLDSLALLSSGKVMAWGDNRDGQLGNGNQVNSSLPTAVHGLTGVTRIVAGGLFNLALLGDTSVKAWGAGDAGELGNGGTTFRDVPVAVKGLTGVTAIAGGDEHAFALLKGGSVKAWGSNSFGELGEPSAGFQSNVPVKVSALSNVTAVSAGGASSLALLSGATVKAWGDNAVGQLGTGTTTESNVPVPIPGLSAVTAISDGANHALALRSSAGAENPGLAETPWHSVPTPFPGAPPPTELFSAAFSGVSAATSGDAWAVGTNTSGGRAASPFSEHWNGTAWSVVPMPAPAERATTLTGVLDRAPGDAWAVGRSETTTNSVERTLIEHWNGTAWSIVPSPNPFGGPGANDALEAIAGVSAKDIWAAGEGFREHGRIELLFEHFDGKSWKAVASPPPVGDDFALGLTTIASNDAWAVGTSTFSRTLAAHWDGKRWSIVPTPSLEDGIAPTNLLTGVSAVASKNVWASGYEDNVNQTNFKKPYLLHWDGSSWKLILAPNAGSEGSRLAAIRALSASDVWAVGQTQENDGSILNLTERFDGSTWKRVPSPSPGEIGPATSNTLQAVASPGGGLVWALGSQEMLGVCCVQPLALEAAKG